MCGFAGILTDRRDLDVPKLLDGMTAALRHRADMVGQQPEACFAHPGIGSDAPVGFSHNPPATLDLRFLRRVRHGLQNRITPFNLAQ